MTWLNETRLNTKKWMCEENSDNQGPEGVAGVLVILASCFKCVILQPERSLEVVKLRQKELSQVPALPVA